MSENEWDDKTIDRLVEAVEDETTGAMAWDTVNPRDIARAFVYVLSTPDDTTDFTGRMRAALDSAGERWRWVYVGPKGTEGARLDYTDCVGAVAATVFLHRDHHGHNWFVWDENGTGGENSSEPTIEAAQREAIHAAIRWGKHAIVARC